MILLSFSVAMENVRQCHPFNTMVYIKQRQIGRIQIKTILQGSKKTNVVGLSTRDFQMRPGGTDNLCINAASKEEVSY